MRNCSLIAKKLLPQARWNDELLPALITTRGKRRREVIERLRRRLPEVRTQGVEAFLFRDLSDPLKHDVRARWAAMLGQSARDVAAAEDRGGTAGVVRIELPDSRADERESFDHLVRRVAESLDRLGADEKTRRYLAGLWSFLSRQAIQPEAGGNAAPRAMDSGPEPSDEQEGRLSQRKVARQLDIPRERLPELLQILGRVVEECRAAEVAQAGRPPHREEE